MVISAVKVELCVCSRKKYNIALQTASFDSGYVKNKIVQSIITTVNCMHSNK